MTATHINGHRVVCDDEGNCIYEDGESAMDEEGNVVYRPCPKCNGFPSEEGHDFCLKRGLPGVKNVCCGHGIEGKGYISFEGGITIYFDKITEIKNLSGGNHDRITKDIMV